MKKSFVLIISLFMFIGLAFANDQKALLKETLGKINENTEMSDTAKLEKIKQTITEALGSGLDHSDIVQISLEVGGLNPVEMISFLVQQGVTQESIVSGADLAGVSPAIVAQGEKQGELALNGNQGDSNSELGFSNSPTPAPIVVVSGGLGGGGGSRPASPSTP